MTVKIPVEKTVKVTGNTLPGKVNFFFGVQWNNPDRLPISVRFENAASNTVGELIQTSANTYTIVVDGEATVKGHIVITGYADDLDGLTLTTWEKLSPYATAEEALAAGWVYDQTATGTLRWTVTLSKVNPDAVNADIALGQQGGQAAISFENVYAWFETPELPDTGDNSMPMLYLLLAASSLLGILLLRRKRVL